MITTLIIITILILNLLVVFATKSRVNMVILINIANLTTILLYCLVIDNFLIIKELSIATIIYSIIISSLIISSQEKAPKTIYRSKTLLTFLSIIMIICASATLYLANNINDDLLAKKEQNINNKIIKSQTKNKAIANKNINYLNNKSSKDNIIFNRFGDFLIIICAITTFLFLGVKHRRKEDENESV